MTDTTLGEIVDEASNWNVGAGIVTMALFPMALPGIALAIVAAIPLLALALPALLIWGVAVAVSRLVRGVRRLVTELRRHGRADREVMRARPAA